MQSLVEREQTRKELFELEQRFNRRVNEMQEVPAGISPTHPAHKKQRTIMQPGDTQQPIQQEESTEEAPTIDAGAPEPHGATALT